MSRPPVNLIRDQVSPPARRRLLYTAWLAYLGLAGILLAYEMNRATRLLLHAHRLNADMQVRLSAFQSAHHVPGRLEDHMARLCGDIEQSCRHLEDLDRQLQQRLLPARLLFGLPQPLPADGEILSLQFSRRDRTLNFSVLAEADRDATLSRPSQWLARWCDDPLLPAPLRNIRPLVTERTHWNGKLHIVHRFACTLPAGKEPHGPGPVPAE